MDRQAGALRRGVDEAGDVDFLLFTDAESPTHRARSPRSSRPRRPTTLTGVADGAVAGADALERLIVPAFVYFFAMLYPFRWVNGAGSRTARRRRGQQLVRRGALELAGGVDAVRDAVIDDVAIARIVKRTGGRTGSGWPIE